jgi:ABC-2 type transport system permease protein
MIHRLASLIVKELIQFARDRILLVMAFMMPIIQIYLLGNAIGQDIQNISIAVIDYDRSSLSREIVQALDNTVELTVEQRPDSLAEARALVNAGEAVGIVVIPPDFMEDTRSPTNIPQIQVILDGSSSFTAGRALQAAQGAVQSLVDDAQVTASDGPLPGVRVYAEALFNSTLDFQDDAITSQLALITFQITAIVAVMGIVRERDIGTIEMLTITPLKRLELIGGKAITPFIIGLVNFVLMFVVTQVVFGVPQRGSFLLLLGLTALYLACEIGYALTISTITRSQQQAITVVFVWAMFTMMLSGYMVSVEILPQALQWVSWLIPLRHYLAIVRGVMTRGAGIGSLLPEVGTLALLTVVMLFVARRTLSRVIE